MHVGGGQPAHVDEEVPLGVVGEVMGLVDGELGVNGDVSFGP
jgi:hypothetical protein